jgi:pimeloyl-ACP methyl ester carboxylesterase
MTTRTAHTEFTFPKSFRAQNIATNGTKLHVRVGGAGPAVVLLHGYGETGDMWVSLAKDLARDRTVIVPDLRGMGLSTKPTSGAPSSTGTARAPLKRERLRVLKQS